MPHFKVIDWFNTQSLEMQGLVLALLVQQICSFIVGILPQSAGEKSLVVKAMARIANTRFADAPGTWKLPGMAAHDHATRSPENNVPPTNPPAPGLQTPPESER